MFISGSWLASVPLHCQIGPTYDRMTRSQCQCLHSSISCWITIHRTFTMYCLSPINLWPANAPSRNGWCNSFGVLDLVLGHREPTFGSFHSVSFTAGIWWSFVHLHHQIGPTYGQTTGSQHRCLLSSIDIQFTFHCFSSVTNQQR